MEMNLYFVEKLKELSDRYDLTRLQNWLKQQSKIKSSSKYDKSWVVLKEDVAQIVKVHFSKEYFEYALGKAKEQPLVLNSLIESGSFMHSRGLDFLTKDQKETLLELASQHVSSSFNGYRKNFITWLLEGLSGVPENMENAGILVTYALEYLSDCSPSSLVSIAFKPHVYASLKCKKTAKIYNTVNCTLKSDFVIKLMAAELLINYPEEKAEQKELFNKFLEALEAIELKPKDVKLIVNAIKCSVHEYGSDVLEYIWTSGGLTRFNKLVLHFIKEKMPQEWDAVFTSVVASIKEFSSDMELNGTAPTKEQFELMINPFLSAQEIVQAQGFVGEKLCVDSFYLNWDEAETLQWHQALADKTSLTLHHIHSVKLQVIEAARAEKWNLKHLAWSICDTSANYLADGTHLLDKLSQRSFSSCKQELQALTNCMNKYAGTEQEFVKIGFLLEVVNDIIHLKNSSPQEVLELAKLKYKGWYDVGRNAPKSIQWKVFFARKAKKELTAEDLFNKPKDVATVDAKYLEHTSLILDKFSPYDARGGFNAHTFEKLCEYIGLPMEFNKKDGGKTGAFTYLYQWRSNIVSAASLAYLYGADFDALKAAVDAEYSVHANANTDTCYVRQMIVHNLANKHSIVDIGAERMKNFRSLLIKHPSLRAQMGLLKKVPFIEGESLEDLKLRMYKNSYDRVPDQLLPHMEHAMSNGWSQEIVDEFVSIVNDRTRKEQYVPQLSVSTENCVVRVLDKEDPTALYIGELSGCCQHINEGAGNDAAIQSYTEPWCGVVAFESPSSKKLLAQSFVWLSKSRETLVLDSIESVFEPEDTAITDGVIPALLKWAKSIKESQGITVALGDTGYGVTSDIWGQLTSDLKDSVKEQGISVYPRRAFADKHTRPFKSLEYTDVDSELLMLK